ncbi:hypothetical protein B0H16DRAFT_1482142 [Mycena metata]|uniref:Uncharacterized protein n=1 Tax=Mycena metata TaxID=1033252 RepID=A0AAD7GUY4_9AGAR|nr:hypothetical protein B0H16DRAFT_1482142 [Mycena metata]
MLGRVDRDGQTRPTFCWSLAGQGTIDMLLMLMALRKASIAKDYMTLDRRAEFFKTYVARLTDGEAQEDETAPEIEQIDVEIEEGLASAAKQAMKRPAKSQKGAVDKKRWVKKPTEEEDEGVSEKAKGKRRHKSTPELESQDEDEGGNAAADKAPPRKKSKPVAAFDAKDPSAAAAKKKKAQEKPQPPASKSAEAGAAVATRSVVRGKE